MENRKSEPPRCLVDRVRKRSLKKATSKSRNEQAVSNQGSARVPSQEFVLGGRPQKAAPTEANPRAPPATAACGAPSKTQNKDNSLTPERVSYGEAAGYLAACFLCRSVQTDTAELGSTALSPPSMWRMMPSLSMTMLARRAHS